VEQVKLLIGYMKNAVTVGWDAINEQRLGRNSRWNKAIER
jgi:putative spermidine/putrescine transport system substrate-binding protein